jgi:hypothetical protein
MKQEKIRKKPPKKAEIQKSLEFVYVSSGRLFSSGCYDSDNPERRISG